MYRKFKPRIARAEALANRKGATEMAPASRAPHNCFAEAASVVSVPKARVRIRIQAKTTNALSLTIPSMKA
jgi:hypothetical protein